MTPWNTLETCTQINMQLVHDLFLFYFDHIQIWRKCSVKSCQVAGLYNSYFVISGLKAQDTAISNLFTTKAEAVTTKSVQHSLIMHHQHVQGSPSLCAKGTTFSMLTPFIFQALTSCIDSYTLRKTTDQYWEGNVILVRMKHSFNKCSEIA